MTLPVMSGPSRVRVRQVDDDLLSHLDLIPTAAALAGWAIAGDWYLLQFLPGAGELRLLAAPAADRCPLVLRQRGRVVQIKSLVGRGDRPLWRLADPALAQIYLGVAGLPLRGIASALRSQVDPGWRVELTVNGVDHHRTSALFVVDPGKDVPA